MKRMREGGPGGRRRSKPIRLVGSCLATVFLALGGCSYLETIAQRTAAPDDRIQLGPGDDAPFLRRHEIQGYTCVEQLLLQCERAGTKFSCRCVSR